MRILIETQYSENYAAPDWDGVSEFPYYWKQKGGESYFLPVPEAFPLADVSRLVDDVRSQVEWANNYSQSYIVSWEVVPDDYVTEDEKMQLEWEGRISFPTKVLVA
jgi:hypothetical protein